MKKKQTNFGTSFAVLVLLVLVISCSTGCDRLSTEEYYEAVQETFPGMVIVGDPQSNYMWFAIDTTVQPNRYWTCQTKWIFRDKVSHASRLYAYPLGGVR